jgi:hypothetical protein
MLKTSTFGKNKRRNAIDNRQRFISVQLRVDKKDTQSTRHSKPSSRRSLSLRDAISRPGTNQFLVPTSSLCRKSEQQFDLDCFLYMLANRN